MVRIKFERDKDFMNDSGLIDIHASQIDNNLQFLNYEQMLYQQVWIIRQGVKLMNIEVLQRTIKMLEVQLTPYIDIDSRNKIEFESKRSNDLINFYNKQISNQQLKKELTDIEQLKTINIKLEELIMVMNKNKFLFKDKLYLSLLLGHYSDLQRTVIKNPYAFFNSVLLLKSILNPYMYDDSHITLNNILKELTQKLQYVALESRRLPNSESRKKMINTLLNYAYMILSELTLIMDKRGLLAQVEKHADLSKARFDLPVENLNEDERIATEILGDIQDRLHKQNKNWLAVMVGGTGSGKSYSALWLAQALDPSFTIDRVAFTFKEFMDIITNKEIKSGNVIIWDESGVDLDSRMFFSHLNILANRILQTFRKDNLGVIFTVPDATFVDKRSRTLFHAIIETKSIRTSDDKVKVKWFEVHRSVQSKKEAYLWQPRCMVNGKHFKIGSVFIPKPNRELIIPYEKKKNSFTDDLKDNVKAELSDAKTTMKKRKTKSELTSIMSKIVKDDVSMYAKLRNGTYIFSHELLRFKFGLNLPDAKKLKYMLEEFMNK